MRTRFLLKAKCPPDEVAAILGYDRSAFSSGMGQLNAIGVAVEPRIPGRRDVNTTLLNRCRSGVWQVFIR